MFLILELDNTLRATHRQRKSIAFRDNLTAMIQCVRAARIASSTATEVSCFKGFRGFRPFVRAMEILVLPKPVRIKSPARWVQARQ